MTECTIITVCKNAGNEIEKTIKSVLSQKIDMNKIELLFVDGLSSDNTLEIIKKYISKFKEIRIRYISEKDKGIYDAMNKGANLANGEWCLYLNAGDIFFNEDSLSNILNFENKKDFDIIYGDTIHNYKYKYNIVKAKSEKELTYKYGMEFCHQSCIIKTSYQRNNKYSLNYKIAGDYDFFTHAFFSNAKFHHIPKVISIFSKDGISSTRGSLVIKENADVKLKYNIISEKEYKIEVNKAIFKMKLREKLPRFIIKKRNDLIMNKNTKNWLSFDEIKKSVKK